MAAGSDSPRRVSCSASSQNALCAIDRTRCDAGQPGVAVSAACDAAAYAQPGRRVGSTRQELRPSRRHISISRSSGRLFVDRCIRTRRAANGLSTVPNDSTLLRRIAEEAEAAKNRDAYGQADGSVGTLRFVPWCYRRIALRKNDYESVKLLANVIF